MLEHKYNLKYSKLHQIFFFWLKNANFLWKLGFNFTFLKKLDLPNILRRYFEYFQLFITFDEKHFLHIFKSGKSQRIFIFDKFRDYCWEKIHPISSRWRNILKQILICLVLGYPLALQKIKGTIWIKHETESWGECAGSYECLHLNSILVDKGLASNNNISFFVI